MRVSVLLTVSAFVPTQHKRATVKGRAKWAVWDPLNVCFLKMIVKMTSLSFSSFFFTSSQSCWHWDFWFYFWGSKMSMDRNWGSPEGEWGLFMISAREMRPKDRIREGVIKTSQSVVRMHSGVLVRFWWVWERLWRSEGWWGILSLHRTSFRDCSPRTPGSVCPGQTCYIIPLLLVVSPVSP